MNVSWNQRNVSGLNVSSEPYVTNSTPMRAVATEPRMTFTPLSLRRSRTFSKRHHADYGTDCRHRRHPDPRLDSHQDAAGDADPEAHGNRE